MSLSMPNSMDECIYFTRRVWEPKGKAIGWVRRVKCPKCGKAEMGKPLDPKTKKPKIRADTYECPTCHFSQGKLEHEEGLSVEVIYTCPHCGASGEATTPYKRRLFEGVPSYVFECNSCNSRIGLTKKMKSKKGKPEDNLGDD